MIWSWRTRSNSQSGLGAELLLPAKSAFCFCCLSIFPHNIFIFIFYHFVYFFFTWFFFVLRNYHMGALCFFFDTVLVHVSCPFSLPFFSVFFFPLSTPSKILPKVIMTLNFARNWQVSGGEGVVSIIFSCREILLGRVPNGNKLSMWTLQILPRPSTASTGTTSRRYFEWMESPLTLLRSSKASMKTLTAVSVMVTSPHWCQAGVCHVHTAFQSCCGLDHAANHWGSV